MIALHETALDSISLICSINLQYQARQSTQNQTNYPTHKGTYHSTNYGNRHQAKSYDEKAEVISIYRSLLTAIDT